MKTLKQILDKTTYQCNIISDETREKAVMEAVEEWLKQFTLTIRTQSDKELITEFINEELLYQLQMVEGKEK